MPLAQRQSGFRNSQPAIIVPHAGESSSNSWHSEDESRHDELVDPGDEGWEDEELYDDVQPSDSASTSNGPSHVRHHPALAPKRRHHRLPHRPAVQQHHPRAAPAHAPASPTSFMDSSEEYGPYAPRGYGNQQVYYGGPHGGHAYHQNHGRAGGGHFGQGYPGGQMVPSSYYDHPFSPMSNGSGPSYFGPEPRHYGMAQYQPQYYGGHPQYNLPPNMQQYQMTPHVPPPATEAPAASTTPAPDPEKEKIKEQLRALQAEKDKAMMLQRQAEIEAKIRQNAEENLRQHKLELEHARVEAERLARERLEAERKAEEQRQKHHAEAMKRAEENARARIEAEMKAAEEQRKREAEALAKAEELARIRLEAAMKKEAEAKAEAEKKAAEEVERIKRMEEAAKMKAEAEAAKKIADEKEAEKKKAEAEAAEKAAAEELKKKIEDETKAKLEAAAKSDEQKPIRFKDAVGRKFSFPFHLCKTWGGMEELIRQAFVQVEKLGPHVQEGHYDLTGPDGEIILPSVWDKVVQPDWLIVMTMWPIEDDPLPGPRFPPGVLGGKHGKGGGPPINMPSHIGGRVFGGGAPPGKRPGVKIPPAPPTWVGAGRRGMPEGIDVVTAEPPPTKKKDKRQSSSFATFLTGQSGKKSSSKKK